MSKLDLDTLKDIQVADGQISESVDYANDSKERYLLVSHRLPHLLVAIHLQNNHVGYARDKQTLAHYTIAGMSRKELEEFMYAYRQLCLHCARCPHLLRMPLNRILIGRRPRSVL